MSTDGRKEGEHLEQQIWLAVDASTGGVVRLARVDPSTLAVGRSYSLTDREHPTLTSAFQAFEQAESISLRGAVVAIAIAGVAVGSTIPIVRSRWIVSRLGLEAYFGRPVTIVNEVAAKACALIGLNNAMLHALADAPMPNWSDVGRWALVSLADGLGVAAIDVDRKGTFRVIETEAGHCGFCPQTALEAALLDSLRRDTAYVSWENAFNAIRTDYASHSPIANMSLEARRQMMAQLLGSLASDVVLGLGAWNGAFVSGVTGIFASQGREAAFLARVRQRRPFQRLFGNLPCWVTKPQDAVLHGCAKLISSS